METHDLIPPTTDDRLIWDIWLSRWQLPVMTAADEIGLFQLLADGPLAAGEVAERLDLGGRGAQALLAALASLGLLVQRGRRFGLTDTARQFLLPTSDYYWGGMVRRPGATQTQDVLAALRRDAHPEQEPDTRHVVAWASGDIDEERARTITAAMHAHSFPAAMGAARNGDFSGVRRLLDVAGGSGCFPIALTHQHPDLRCTVMELAPVCRVAEEYIARYGAIGHVDTLAANMFADEWPQGYDACFFSNIFHDWDPERCALLARKAFTALPSGGRIYLHEMLLADTKDGPLPAALFSITMLAGNYGKQFSLAELDQLLTTAGFINVRASQTYAYYSLISAHKP
jgi:hypothetical protein